ncbi:MAG TPA: hypothetical protein VME46_17030, partial [Acidimicrobiales bacterium]|nr:hypothetical protein [Acidimicrobiales bacterium]
MTRARARLVVVVTAVLATLATLVTAAEPSNAQGSTSATDALAWSTTPAAALAADGGGQELGLAVSANGSVVVVGSNTGGPLCVYAKSTEGTWPTSPTATIPPVADPTATFGRSVAISAGGQEIIASGAGAAYIYIQTAGQWPTSPSQTITATASTFGWPVALSDDGQTALVGSSGAAYVYTEVGGIWPSAPTATLSGAGGAALALSGNGEEVLSGAPLSGSGGNAYLYEDVDGSWTTSSPVVLSGTGQVGGGFGSSVALSDNGQTLMVGEPNADDGASPYLGAVYIYSLADLADWDILYAPAGSEEFGTAIAISSDGQTAL